MNGLEATDITTGAPIIGKPSLMQRSAMAVQHLIAASRSSRQCREIQDVNRGLPLGPFFDDLIACVSSTVMLSVASIEANINEHIEDADKLLPELSDGARREFCDLVSQLPILKKYERVLAIKELPIFDRGVSPYQDVDILIAIRNELVHFHPEWHDRQKRHAKLGKRILYRFKLSPFITEESAVVFPTKFIGHGCTKWAVDSALTFMEQFADLVRLPSRFEPFRDRLMS